MQEALVRHFRSARLAVPNADFDYEIDLAVVTSSNLLYDVEIKCSLGDWNADLKKKKWRDGCFPVETGEHMGFVAHWERISRFYYAIRSGMEKQIPRWVQDWIGIIVISPDSERFWTAKECRPAKRSPKARKLTEEEVADLGRKLHFRYWASRGTWPGIKDLDEKSTYMHKPEFMVRDVEKDEHQEDDADTIRRAS